LAIPRLRGCNIYLLVALTLVPDWRIERTDVSLTRKPPAQASGFYSHARRLLLGGLSSVDHFRVFAFLYLECRYPVHLGFIWVCFNIGAATAIEASY
jgi:hypothetical protein